MGALGKAHGANGSATHAQVPFIAWTADIPFAGKGVQRALAAAAKPFASYVMATTGEQFFLLDGSDEDGRPPLLVCSCYQFMTCRRWRLLRAQCHSS
jgi:hypothetical protein